MLRITSADFFLSDDHFKSFETITKKPLQAATTTLRLAKLRQKYAILCNASYYSGGFILMIEDQLEHKNCVKKTTICTSVLWLSTF